MEGLDEVEDQCLLLENVCCWKTGIGIPNKDGYNAREPQFRWTCPFWIINSLNGTYQVGSLLGEVIPKWINGFRF